MAGGMGPAGWVVQVQDQETIRKLKDLGGDKLAGNVERATTEAGARVVSEARALAHVGPTGNMRAGLASIVRREGLQSVAEVGTPVPYGPLEELRGLDEDWGTVTLARAAANPADGGGHAFLSPAVIRNTEFIEALYWEAVELTLKG